VVRDEDEVLNEYADPRDDPFATLVVPVLKEMPLDELRARSDMGRSAVIEIRQGRSIPHPKNRDRLTRVAAEWLRIHSPELSRTPDDLMVCLIVSRRRSMPRQI